MEPPIVIPQDLTWKNREHADAIREVRYQANEFFHDVLEETKKNVPSRVPQGASSVERDRVYRVLAKEGFEKWKSLVSRHFKDNPSARDLLLVETVEYYRFRFLGNKTFKAPLEEVFHKAYPPAPDIASLNQKV